jgi:ketosteroid isomerase-like protein
MEKTTVQSFFDLVNERNLDKLESLLSHNAEFFFPKTQPLIGKKRIIKFLSLLFRQYPELTFTIQRIIIQENQAAVLWTNRGRNRKNQTYENEGVTILEAEKEKITFISDFFKDTEKF